jgi:hypothetical protein
MDTKFRESVFRSLSSYIGDRATRLRQYPLSVAKARAHQHSLLWLSMIVLRPGNVGDTTTNYIDLVFTGAFGLSLWLLSNGQAGRDV